MLLTLLIKLNLLLNLLKLINGLQPEFTRNIPNLSIVKGKEAFLRCSISNLGEHKIIWTHVDTQQLISIQEHVIHNKNERISIHVVGDTFELRIKNISLEDKGYYMCQINCNSDTYGCTSKSQVGFLNVVVPPKFDNTILQSESNITIKEFENVSIMCSATGNPNPSIYWKREDFYLNEKNINGNKLNIISATRQDSGVYICIASNGIQPSISRRYYLIVQFAPMIRIPTQVNTVYVGDNAKLECFTESNPLAEHIWLNKNGDQINHKKKHRFHYFNKHNSHQNIQNHNSINNTSNYHRKYQYRLKKSIESSYLFELNIKHVSFEEAGQYVCLVKNSLGEAKSSIQLKVINKNESKKPKNELTYNETKITDNKIKYKPEKKKPTNLVKNQYPNQIKNLLKKKNCTSCLVLNIYLFVIILFRYLIL